MNLHFHSDGTRWKVYDPATGRVATNVLSAQIIAVAGQEPRMQLTLIGVQAHADGGSITEGEELIRLEEPAPPAPAPDTPDDGAPAPDGGSEIPIEEPAPLLEGLPVDPTDGASDGESAPLPSDSDGAHTEPPQDGQEGPLDGVEVVEGMVPTPEAPRASRRGRSSPYPEG